MTETRYQRITREQAERRAAREERATAPKRRRKPHNDEPHSPSLDPDGRWRDNLGESPDY